MTENELKKELDLYKKMYMLLFNTITDVIKRTDDDLIKQMLMLAQQKTEDIYING